MHACKCVCYVCIYIRICMYVFIYLNNFIGMFMCENKCIKFPLNKDPRFGIS